ncbi:MAG: response regulator, partial [Candidatus Paceibacterota bacterium]
MTATRCLLVDDEPVASRIISGYLDQVEGYEVLMSCKNALEAYNFLNQHEVDLMFLDIEMPKIKGFDLLKSLKNPPPVILTTAHREFALESYEFDVVDYLLKPISLQRFLRSLDKYQSLKGISTP